MHFVTLRVTRRFCGFRWIEIRLRSPFRPSATYFDGAKAGNAPGSVSDPTSSGSFALSLTSHSAPRLELRINSANTTNFPALPPLIANKPIHTVASWILSLLAPKVCIAHPVISISTHGVRSSAR
ncbi:hypothetical protein CXB40_23980 [Pseudomonas syringae pv. avii]|nr:hypothetical protein CXB40_23980 [Pseudomonas syringae pv. avii]